ncbi:hypothetical protein [Flavobacterium macrobrachii]|jgi:hypothetical protein|uniref:hypothetical protein n=1 Tax=Flavobacterium macrobrachii TaxID=591204 RepID=UPI0037BFC658
MKKFLFLLIITVQFSFATNSKKEVIENKEFIFASTKESIGPVQCCTRRASSGTYGQPDYNSVSVTRCATSDVSYQDAYSRACSLAAASAEKALSIAESTAGSVTIGGR